MNVRSVFSRLGHDDSGLAMWTFPARSQLVRRDRKIVSTMNASNIHVDIFEQSQAKSIELCTSWHQVTLFYPRMSPQKRMDPKNTKEIL